MSSVGRVLVVGDLNPDLVLQGDVVPRFGQAEQILQTAATVIGGSAGITAHGFARLGRPVSLAAAIGTDAFGLTMTDALANAGVNVSQVAHRTDVPTGLTVVLSNAADRAILTLPGAIPTLTVAEVRSAIAAAPSPIAHVHVCALFLQPGLLDGLAELLAEVRSSGTTTSLDTNDDPAKTWTGIAELLPHLDVVLPNRTEALALSQTLTGTPPANLTQACQSIAACGPLVVAKDGAAGARAVTAHGELARDQAEPTEVVDATGAGDSFNAAFLDAWLGREPVEECLRRGVRAGALSVAGVGGTAAQPTLDLLLTS